MTVLLLTADWTVPGQDLEEKPGKTPILPPPGRPLVRSRRAGAPKNKTPLMRGFAGQRIGQRGSGGSGQPPQRAF